VGVGSIPTYVNFRLHERCRNGPVRKSETVCSYFLLYFVRNYQYHVMVITSDDLNHHNNGKLLCQGLHWKSFTPYMAYLYNLEFTCIRCPADLCKSTRSVFENFNSVRLLRLLNLSTQSWNRTNVSIMEVNPNVSRPPCMSQETAPNPTTLFPVQIRQTSSHSLQSEH
jgi:hypothetical protein